MTLPPLPNVIKLSSEAHYAAIEGTFYISLDFLYAQGRGECIPTQRKMEITMGTKRCATTTHGRSIS